MPSKYLSQQSLTWTGREGLEDERADLTLTSEKLSQKNFIFSLEENLWIFSVVIFFKELNYFLYEVNLSWNLDLLYKKYTLTYFSSLINISQKIYLKNIENILISTKYKSSSSSVSSKTNFEVFWKNIETLRKVRNFKRKGGSEDSSQRLLTWVFWRHSLFWNCSRSIYHLMRFKSDCSGSEELCYLGIFPFRIYLSSTASFRNTYLNCLS